MKKKQHYLIFLLVMVLTQIGIAQTVTITGKVTSKSDGQPLPGASVLLKGESQGSVTNFDGNYSIEVNNPNGKELVFSYIGFKTLTVSLNDSNIINIALEEDATSLDEVVVTALGIKREAKALGYSLTEVGSDDMGRVKTTSAVNALQGRVAGVNISQNSTGAAGSSRVIIRGASSLSGSNQPLYVVDGIPILNVTKASIGRFDGEFGDGGDDISSINPDDIESVSILKGSSAAALYGSQASNGVIMITTKSGKGKKGLGVEFSSSLTFDSVNTDLQDFQTIYGQGRSGLKPGFIYENGSVTALDDGTPEGLDLATSNALSNSTLSWGAMLDGSNAIAWDGIYRPYTNTGNNVKKFYDTGVTAVNTVSVVKGSDDYSYRLSFSNLDNRDVFPNSTLDRKSFSLSGNAKINPKLTSTISAKYIIEKVHNRVGIGDGPGNANNSVLLLPANIDVTGMKPGFNDEGAELPFTSSVWTTNPYWVTDKFNNNDKKKRIIASTTLRYDITDWLYANGRAGIDSYDLSVQRVTPWGTAYRSGGRLYQSKSTYSFFDADMMLGVEKSITSKISTHSVFGGNTKKSTWESLSAQGDDFIVIGLEDLNNTTNPIPSYGLSESKTNSLYASIEVDYDNTFFLTYTGRNEWFSTLSFPGKTSPNDDFYQSISGSLLLHEALKLPKAITYAKLRSSYAQVAGATSPYALNLTYAILGTFQGQAFGQVNGSTIPNPNLVPLEKKEFEIGFDGRFFNNRLHLDVAYYSNKTLNDIVRASATSTSGYTSALLNVGELENKGLELLLGGSPIKNDNFSWNSSINVGYNNSEIVNTNDEGNPITMQLSRTGNANIAHMVGENYGTIVGESYARDENGVKIYTIDGQGIPRPVRADERKVLGNGVAPVTAGFSNEFRYKNVSLNILVDGKFGGQVFSGTNEAAYFSGAHKRTLEGRENGLEVTGIDQATGQEFTTTVPARSLGSYYGYIAAENTGIAEEFIYDTDYIKFREFSLGYSFPKKILKNIFIKEMSVSLIGRNLFYLMKKTDNIDPEASINNSNSQGLERFGVPATRSFGFSLNVKF
ncbi:SusC/RagA family TonB-linked outer membrane protein [Hwangdonia lutea]|uniref:SusC/RagA family TonB-linked outer membrane protein n=1 Tax=Hwangdonia lutea TaxID=3075823 RepID=A0AA97EL80_9FLAO|nr:SusC/RagA family TonB-linked outer membrane protein [Hwangdonia sp. SCSIO 19198]WOD43162.1 SusC/RagA family TonB-linked outer membrane protein [Hwangdonia sp. SCSIO 19198]